jgi:hypothetical protein
MNTNERKSDLTTIYLGNTRTVSNDYLFNYCSKFGFVLDCSRRLISSDQLYLVDFTFVRFLTIESARTFLSIDIHTLDNGITLDVRPFHEIVHTAVPLHVDRKICIRHVPSHVSLNDLRKYLRTFGSIKQANSDIDENEQRFVYIEFESAASRNKLLKGKVKSHRVRDHSLNIASLLRPTDVNLNRIKQEKYDEYSFCIILVRQASVAF